MLRSGIRLSPSDIRYASLRGEYNITATIGSNITVACNNITLTRSAYHFQFDTAFVSTNAMLAKTRTENFHPLSFSVCIRFLVLLYRRYPLEAVFLFIVGEFRLDAVEIKNGEKHEGSQTGVEAAVIEDEAAVHTCG